MNNDTQPNNANDEYDNTLVQNNENIPNRQFPDEDSNEGDNPVDPDKGDTIPANDNDSVTDTGSDSDDVLNESIEDPSEIPSEDVGTSSNQNMVSNEYDDVGNLPNIPQDIDPEQELTSLNPSD